MPDLLAPPTPPSPPTRSKRRPTKARALAHACLLALSVGAASASASTDLVSSASPPAPAFIRQTLPDGRPSTPATLRFLGLRIYDARLWTGPGFNASNFASHPLALELHYHRAFTGKAIAERSVQEIQRQGPLSPAQARAWQQALSGLIPDVQAGDRLTGVHLPGQGLRLWQGERALGTVDDPELARRFYGIWLSNATSEPRLRSALLAPTGAPRP